MATILNSVAKTHRLVIVDEAWKTGSLASEISAYVAEYELWSLDAPVMRVCSQEVPIPYPAHLEKAATPQVEDIVSVMKLVMGRKEGRAA
jgi:pyruvate dehydrogenase E1 component beta subunit/2-oxoisovalerate dehydrogenase E1 component